MIKIILETKRLVLREWKIGEEKQLKTFLGDAAVMYAYEGAFSDEKIAHWLRWTIESYEDKGFGLWAIERKSDHKIIGECGITEQKIHQQLYHEIGYHLVANEWKKGYMTEVAQAVQDYGFRTLVLDELVSIIRDTNIPSMNVAIRNGMTVRERIIKQYQGISMPHFVFHIHKHGEYR